MAFARWEKWGALGGTGCGSSSMKTCRLLCLLFLVTLTRQRQTVWANSLILQGNLASCSTKSQPESNSDYDPSGVHVSTPIMCVRWLLFQQGKLRNSCHSNKGLPHDLIEPCRLLPFTSLSPFHGQTSFCPFHSRAWKVHHPHRLCECCLLRRSP